MANYSWANVKVLFAGKSINVESIKVSYDMSSESAYILGSKDPYFTVEGPIKYQGSITMYLKDLLALETAIGGFDKMTDGNTMVIVYDNGVDTVLYDKIQNVKFLGTGRDLSSETMFIKQEVAFACTKVEFAQTSL